MKQTKNGKQSEADDPETDAQLSKWAGELLEALTEEQLKQVISDYRQTARTAESAEDRAFARRRAKVLSDRS